MKNATAVLIPTYNEEKTIRRVVENCLQHVSAVVIVDDGSIDQTVAKIADLPIQVIKQPQNAGKGSALLAGFAYCVSQNYSGVVTMDADGQHDPDVLPEFFKMTAENPDAFIIGARQINVEQAPKGRLLANKIADFFISWAIGQRLHDTQSGYRYYPSRFLKPYLEQQQHAPRFAFEVHCLIAAMSSGISVHYLPVRSCYPKDARKSHYHPLKDTWPIFKLVAKTILKKGFNLPGLLRVLKS